jgi:23S rRNA (guanosine2251-2'-O)-methyltransferase
LKISETPAGFYNRDVPAAAMPVTFVLDNVRSLFNVGSFFRSADGAGVQELLLTGITGHPPNEKLAKTALGAEQSVAWQHAWNPIPLLAARRMLGHQIVVLETRPDAEDLFDWQPRFPVTILFGHETGGVRQELMDYADTFVRIPMLGTKRSLNVASAAAVVAYEMLRKYRSRLDTTCGPVSPVHS